MNSVHPAAPAQIRKSWDIIAAYMETNETRAELSNTLHLCDDLSVGGEDKLNVSKCTN